MSQELRPEELDAAASGSIWGLRLPKGLWVRIDKEAAGRLTATVALSHAEEVRKNATSGAELVAWLGELVEAQPERTPPAAERA